MCSEQISRPATEILVPVVVPGNILHVILPASLAHSFAKNFTCNNWMHYRENYDFYVYIYTICNIYTIKYIHIKIVPLGFLTHYIACAKLYCGNSRFTPVSSIEAIQIYNGMTDWSLSSDSFPEKIPVWGKIQYLLRLKWRKYDKCYKCYLFFFPHLHQ